MSDPTLQEFFQKEFPIDDKIYRKHVRYIVNQIRSDARYTAFRKYSISLMGDIDTIHHMNHSSLITIPSTKILVEILINKYKCCTCYGKISDEILELLYSNKIMYTIVSREVSSIISEYLISGNTTENIGILEISSFYNSSEEFFSEYGEYVSLTNITDIKNQYKFLFGKDMEVHDAQ